MPEIIQSVVECEECGKKENALVFNDPYWDQGVGYVCRRCEGKLYGKPVGFFRKLLCKLGWHRITYTLRQFDEVETAPAKCKWCDYTVTVDRFGNEVKEHFAEWLLQEHNLGLYIISRYGADNVFVEVLQTNVIKVTVEGMDHSLTNEMMADVLVKTPSYLTIEWDIQ